MNKKILFFGILYLWSVQLTFGQKYYKQQFTLFKYSCVVEEKIVNNLSLLDEYINTKAPDGYSKTHMMMVHSIYAMVKDKMQNKFGVYILPEDSYQDKVDYDDFKFPDIAISNAIKKGNTKYYFKIIASVYTSSKLDATSNEFYPEVKVTIELYNKDGYRPIKTVSGVSSAVGITTVDPGFIKDLEFVKIPADKSTTANSEILKSIINDAIDIALKSL